MSKVDISFDTITDALEVKVDGEKLENVNSVNIYTSIYYNDYNSDDIPETHISISMCEYPETKENLKKYTQLMASQKEDKINYIYGENKKNKLTVDISNFMQKYQK